MRMNEKVLCMLYSAARNNKTKKQAAGVFGKMTAKLRSMGALGDGWGVQFEDKNCDKISSFALPHVTSLNECSTKAQLARAVRGD